jgi:hypothetical protein
MPKPNPLLRRFSKDLTTGDVVMLDALHEASSVLLIAADNLRSIGAHTNAETLEIVSDHILEQLESSAEEIMEGEETEDLEPSQEAFATFDEDLAYIYSDYLSWLEGGPSDRDEYCFGTTKRFADLLRSVAQHYQLTVSEDVTDDQIIEAARDSYESRQEAKRRYK